MPILLSNLEAARRDAILNAALKEFSGKGFDEASTNVMAREAGLSKGLFFHYVGSKQDLFLFLYDYCSDLIHKEYLALMNFKEPDLFERLRQSYLLQLELLRRYPWIFEFQKLSAPTQSTEINKEMERRQHEKQPFCYETMFGSIDESNFREGLDVEKGKQIIFWANVGFTNELLADLQNPDASIWDSDSLAAKLDGFFHELRKLFYK
ncbi:TetR/AcrR family transcriptional regulator [Paenibacillus sp. CC-CFT747]|nr:TetR/AcrR family transcriptional regulator [Paenibacillus sp. CC-CFT747]